MESSELRDVLQSALVYGIVVADKAKAEGTQERLRTETAARSLQDVLDELRATAKRRQAQALDEVGRYCSKARAAALGELKDDARMPCVINYRERYNALLSMDDRNEVLRRLSDTIALAEKALDEHAHVDVESALSQAAVSYAEKVTLLDGITVVAPEAHVADETDTPLDAARVPSGFEAEAAVARTFMDTMGEVPGLKQADVRRAVEAHENDASARAQIGLAHDAARRVADDKLRAGSAAIEGSVLKIAPTAPFEVTHAVELQVDVELVGELAGQVRLSFETFEQVVRDNGLFAAFARDRSFGECKGWQSGYWWDDILYDFNDYEGELPGRDSSADIPDMVEEDEGGDTLERTIERMEEFNGMRYDGFLDDDFDKHVDAFWYGFKKLMVNVNGLFRISTAAFNEYCNGIAASAKESVARMGAASMDEHQLEVFCEDVQKRMSQW